MSQSDTQHQRLEHASAYCEKAVSFLQKHKDEYTRRHDSY